MPLLNHSSGDFQTIVQTNACSLGDVIEKTEYKDRFSWAMSEAGKDAHAIAKHLGISYQAIMKVLAGTTRMLAADNNARAAAFCSVRSDWLATGEGLPFVAESSAPLDDETAEVVSMFRQLSPEDRRSFSAFLALIAHRVVSLAQMREFLAATLAPRLEPELDRASPAVAAHEAGPPPAPPAETGARLPHRQRRP